MLYLLPFVYSFFITVGLLFLIVFVCSKCSFLRVKKKNSNSPQIKKTCRIGGLAIIVGFTIAVILDKNLVISQNLWGILIAAGIIAIFGIHDDFLELEWKTQLFFQVAVAVLVFLLGVRVDYVTHPLGGLIFLNTGTYLIPSIIFVIVWMVAIINAMNWIDGIDGLSGGIALIGALTVFILSQRPEVNQPPVGIISLALSGALLGFLVFNFYPSKILAGTSGSMFMGFILASLAVFAGTKIATALLVMAIPVLDAAWVMWERIRSGTSVFKSDNRHLHYKLLQLGWSQKKVVFFYYAVTVCIAVVAVNTRAIGKIITFSLVTIIMVATLIFVNKKLEKHHAPHAYHS